MEISHSSLDGAYGVPDLFIERSEQFQYTLVIYQKDRHD